MSRTPVLKALERSRDKKKAISHRCEIAMTQAIVILWNFPKAHIARSA